MVWREMQRVGISLMTHPSELRFGITHEQVVIDVIEGRADFGTCRTDTIEGMISAGKIRGNELTIIEPRSFDGFPFRISTELYPEWPLAAQPYLDQSIETALVKALIGLQTTNASHAASVLRTSQIREWVPALSYLPVYIAINEIGLIDSKGLCTRDDKLYEGLVCPIGHMLLPENQIYAAECPDGQICLKTPCRPLCSAGTYMKVTNSGCLPCPDGMQCLYGIGPPLLSPGFWNHADDDILRKYSVYRCRDSHQCPGGVSGTCAEHRGGIGCSNCLKGWVSSSDGGCRECKADQAWPIVGFIVGLVIALLLLCRISMLEVSNVSLANISVGIIFSQWVVTAQAMAVLGNINIAWVEPIRSVLKVLSFASFRIELLNVGCALPESNFVGLLAVKLLMLPALLVLLVIMFGIVAKCKQKQLKLDMVVNGGGIVVFALYLSASIVACTPFQCLSSPNGTRSVASYPALLCDFGAEFVSAVVIGAIGIFVYSLLPLIWVFYLTYRYPRLISNGMGNMVLIRYRFLFQRFTPERHFFGALYLSRNFIIAILPVVFADCIHRQILCFSLVLLALGFPQMYWQPWRGLHTNFLDAIFTLGILLFLLFGALLTPNTNYEVLMLDTHVFLMVVICLVSLSLIGVAVRLGYRSIFPQRLYWAFLSHHKRDCAVGARLMKMDLEVVVKRSVFLDADDLDDLEVLMDIVRTAVDRFVLLLTPDMLWRPWCAGEITIAFDNNLAFACVVYDGYIEPAEMDLTPRCLASKWTISSFAPLQLQGITVEGVSEAYKFVKRLHKVLFLRVKNNYDNTCENGAKLLLKSLAYGSTTLLDPTPPENPLDTALVVIGDGSDGEAISAAQVLKRMLLTATQKVTSEVVHPRSVIPSIGPSHRVVLLTRSCFGIDMFIRTYYESCVMWGDALLCPIKIDFEFPSQDTLAASLYPRMAMCLGLSEEIIEVCFNPLFQVLAYPFSPAGSYTVMLAEVNRIAMRCVQRSSVSTSATPHLINGNSSRRSRASAASRTMSKENSTMVALDYPDGNTEQVMECSYSF